jgi:dienelactone hydrolase
MTTSEGAGARTITEHELAQYERANQTGRPPVVFVHGLWLLPSSWDRWAALFEEHGYVALTPGGRTTPTPSRRPRPISGEKDHTVPWAIANASFKQQQDNEGMTEIVERKGRGHALIVDSGWREVADTALAFVRRFTGGR